MNAISCHLAFYDAENPAPGAASYWHWHPREISTEDLDRFYSVFAKPCRPGSIADARSGGIYGGIAKLSEGWTVVFRFGDGGRNSAGRPGRTVIVAVFCRSVEAQGLNLAGLFHCQQVESLLAEAFAKCPTPKPDRVEFAFEATPAKADTALLAQAITQGGITTAGDGFLDRAAITLAHLPEQEPWLVKVGRRDDTSHDYAEIRKVMPNSQPPPIPPVSPPPERVENKSLNRHLKNVVRGLSSIPRGWMIVILLLMLAAAASMIPTMPFSTDTDVLNIRHPVPSSPGSQGEAESGQSFLDTARKGWEEFLSALKWFILGLVAGGGIVSVVCLLAWRRFSRKLARP